MNGGDESPPVQDSPEDRRLWEYWLQWAEIRHTRFNAFLVAETLLVVGAAAASDGSSSSVSVVRAGANILGFAIGLLWIAVSHREKEVFNYLQEMVQSRIPEYLAARVYRPKGVPIGNLMSYGAPTMFLAIWILLAVYVGKWNAGVIGGLSLGGGVYLGLYSRK